MTLTKHFIILATRNRHKAEEIAAILGNEIAGMLIMSDFPNAPDLLENENSFEGNATAKAVQFAKWLHSQHPGQTGFVLADDSGLEVDYLNGAPGIHSARFAAMDTGAAGNSKDPDNNAKLMRLLKDVPQEKRTARFRCVLALTPLQFSETKVASPVCDADEAELSTELFKAHVKAELLWT